MLRNLWKMIVLMFVLLQAGSLHSEDSKPIRRQPFVAWKDITEQRGEFVPPQWMIDGYLAALTDRTPGALIEALQFPLFNMVFPYVARRSEIGERFNELVALQASSYDIGSGRTMVPGRAAAAIGYMRHKLSRRYLLERLFGERQDDILVALALLGDVSVRGNILRLGGIMTAEQFTAVVALSNSEIVAAVDQPKRDLTAELLTLEALVQFYSHLAGFDETRPTLETIISVAAAMKSENVGYASGPWTTDTLEAGVGKTLAALHRGRESELLTMARAGPANHRAAALTALRYAAQPPLDPAIIQSAIGDPDPLLRSAGLISSCYWPNNHLLVPSVLAVAIDLRNSTADVAMDALICMVLRDHFRQVAIALDQSAAPIRTIIVDVLDRRSRAGSTFLNPTRYPGIYMSVMLDDPLGVTRQISPSEYITNLYDIFDPPMQVTDPMEFPTASSDTLSPVTELEVERSLIEGQSSNSSQSLIERMVTNGQVDMLIKVAENSLSYSDAAVSALRGIHASPATALVKRMTRDKPSLPRIDFLGQVAPDAGADVLAGVIVKTNLEFDAGRYAEAAINALAQVDATGSGARTATIVFLEEGLDRKRRAFARFYAQLFSGGNEDVRRLLELTAWPTKEMREATVYRIRNSAEAPRESLNSIAAFWELTAEKEELRKELRNAAYTVVSESCPAQIKSEGWRFKLAGFIDWVWPDNPGVSAFVRPTCWTAADLPALELWQGYLANPRDAALGIFEKAINDVKRWDVAGRLLPLAALHLGLWTLLLVAYPWSRNIQSVFFWNPFVRKWLGLGYVGFLLTYVPPLRRLLLAPFRDHLVADANLASLDQERHFVNQKVRNEQGGESLLKDTIKRIRGRIVIEGESGAGKSWALRRLIKDSKNVTVFLPAWRCDKGVLEAIKTKVQWLQKDDSFLAALIHAGAIDIAIDGLNEVSSDTRHLIVNFVTDHFGGNVLLSCQPIQWRKPAGAQTYTIVPMSLQDAKAFLLDVKPDSAKDDYVRHVDSFFASIDAHLQDREDEAAMRLALQNPMDLTFVSEILARGETPDLLNLQEQAFKRAQEDFRTHNQQREFPLGPFSEKVYAVTKADDDAGISDGDFSDEIISLDKTKLMVRREVRRPDGVKVIWRFRHDKIRDFFLRYAFVGDHKDRQNLHLSDPRFRGVYLLLAQRLPLKEAEALRTLGSENAASTGDHTLSDEMVRRVRARIAQSKIAA